MNGGHEQDVWYDWNDMQIQPLTLWLVVVVVVSFS